MTRPTLRQSIRRRPSALCGAVNPSISMAADIVDLDTLRTREQRRRDHIERRESRLGG